MNQLLKPWSLAALAALAFFTFLGSTPAALASDGQRGESSKYTLEMVGGSRLATRNNRAEARNGGNLLEVWRGATNNFVWMSLNLGTAFQAPTATATNVAPAVVAWGPFGDFMVFYTGTDGQIWYTFVVLNEQGSPVVDNWTAIPFQSTFQPVSVAQMGGGSGNVYMVYLSSIGDHRIYGTWYNVSTDSWSQAVNINGGLATSGPSITLAPAIPAGGQNVPYPDRLIVTAVGTDDNIWSTGQAIGANAWDQWRPVLGQVDGIDAGHNLVNGPVASGSQVHTAVNQNTDGTETLVMDVLDSNHNPEFATFNIGIPQLTDYSSNWTVDLSGFQATETPELTSDGNSVFSLITGEDDLAYWKQEYSE